MINDTHSTTPNTKIMRAILDQKIDELKATAYDLRLNAEIALAQAEVYEGKDRDGLLEAAGDAKKKASSAEAGILRLIDMRRQLPDPKSEEELSKE